MAYKIVLSNQCSTKLAAIFSYLEKNFPPDTIKTLVEKIDRKMIMLSQQPNVGIASSKISGVYKISIGRSNKLYYRVKRRKIIILDLVVTNILLYNIEAETNS